VADAAVTFARTLVFQNGAVQDWGQIGGIDHKDLVHTGETYATPDFTDFIRTQTAGVVEEFKVLPVMADTPGEMLAYQVAFRYNGQAFDFSPGLRFELFVDGVQWGDTYDFSVDTGGVDKPNTMMFQFNKPITDWVNATIRLIRLTSLPEEPAKPPPDEDLDFMNEPL